jgi:hypothetical protein
MREAAQEAANPSYPYLLGQAAIGIPRKRSSKATSMTWSKGGVQMIKFKLQWSTWVRHDMLVKIQVIEHDLCIVSWLEPPNPALVKYYLQGVRRHIEEDRVRIEGMCARRDDQPFHQPFSLVIDQEGVNIRIASRTEEFSFPDGPDKDSNFVRLKLEINSWTKD